jgi:hypothetical protein
MGADPTREAATCGHPPVGAADNTQAATATDQYATRHDPFVYFHSVIDNAAPCAGHVVNLNGLTNDLKSIKTTPNYAFITPDLCADGHDATCADPARPGGYAGINGFLSTWAPKILASAAYKQDGLVMILFDEGHTDATACCGEIAAPLSGTPHSARRPITEPLRESATARVGIPPSGRLRQRQRASRGDQLYVIDLGVVRIA